MKKDITVSLKNYKEQICALVMIIILGLFQVLRCIEYPGLYYDAINPDYLAVQVLYPQIKNPLWIVPHVGLPLLGQLYHGTLTAWMHILAVGLTGSATLLTIRIVNMVYVIGICWVCYLICKRTGVNRVITFSGIAVIMLSPQVYSFIRTQYYIKLPGVFLLFLSLYCLIVFSSSKRGEGNLLVISGMLCGLAFYSYFIYLFYVPAMVFFCMNQAKEGGKNRGVSVLVWLTGFLGGSIFYIIGYFDMLITGSDLNYETKKIIVYIFTIIAGMTMAGYCISCAKHYKNIVVLKKIYCGLFCILIAGSVIVVVNIRYIMHMIVPQVDALNIMGNKIGFLRKVNRIFEHWYGVMSNGYLEELMLDKNTSILSGVYVGAVILLMIISFFYYKEKRHDDKILNVVRMFVVLLCSYFLFSLLFISRMGGQHFTPTYFITFMIIILELGHLHLINRNWIFHLIKGLLILSFIINIVNSNLLNTNVKIVGGNNKYSSAINQLSTEALEHKMAGEKTVYIFPEWGLYSGFNYLTLNQIPVLLSVNTSNLNRYLKDGYTYKLCAWDEGKILEYQKALENVGIKNIMVEYVISNDGSKAFYMMYSE